MTVWCAIFTLVGVQSLVALQWGWEASVRRSSRCHNGKGAETQTQPWVVWPGCLLCDPHQGHQELTQHHSLGDWSGAPCAPGISHCWRRNDIHTNRAQAGLCFCGKYGGIIHVLCVEGVLCGMVCALWQGVCSVEGVLSFHTAGHLVLQKLPLGTWDGQSLGSPLLCLPWMELGQWPWLHSQVCFGAPAGCKQCCGSWSRLERQLCPAQKVCEKSRCFLSWATRQPSFLVKHNQSLPCVAQGLQGAKVEHFGFHLSDSKIKKCKFWILSGFFLHLVKQVLLLQHLLQYPLCD